MMVADTSAIMAIIIDETEGQTFHKAMRNDGEVLVSTASAVELMIVAMGRSDDIYQAAIQFLKHPFVRLIPLDQAQMRAATDAYERYGKGRGHPAGLNLGDTFAYALATVRHLPLLFKGDDFNQTDIAPVM